MSRLYVNAYGDGKGPVSRAGDSRVSATFLLNWNGGREPDAEVEVRVAHCGDKVVLEVMWPRGLGRDGKEVKWNVFDRPGDQWDQRVCEIKMS